MNIHMQFMLALVIGLVLAEALSLLWSRMLLRKMRMCMLQLDRANTLLVKCNPHVADTPLSNAISAHFDALIKEFEGA